MPTRTLEQRIKFDHGLPIGQSLVRFTLAERHVIALVDISPRGLVHYFVKPDAGDMYSSWQRVRGDVTRTGKPFGAVKVWAARDAEFMARFEGVPIADIPVRSAVDTGPAHEDASQAVRESYAAARVSARDALTGGSL